MSVVPALKPVEAASIAANAYFTLAGWDEYTAKREATGQKDKSLVKKGVASNAVLQKQVISGGERALKKVGISGTMKKTLTAKTGSRMNKASSGFGYMLTFKRGGRKHLVVATRGTRSEMGPEDLITDGNVSPFRLFPGVGLMHAGFYDTFKSLRSQLDLPLLSSVDYVHCIGHSLGGAIANLVAIYAAKSLGKKNVALYTFGAPRVGLEFCLYHKMACRYLGADNIYRVGHQGDIVPLICLPPYQHVHPQLTSKQNFYMDRHAPKLSMTNHDTGAYIETCRGKSWQAMNAASIKTLTIDRAFFSEWINDENWIKSRVGRGLNMTLGLLVRVVSGLVQRSVLLLGMGIASPIDLVAVVVQKGAEYIKGVSEFAIRLVKEVAKVFGMVVGESALFFAQLLEKMKTFLKKNAHMAITSARKNAKKRSFQSIVPSATDINVESL